MKLWQNTIYLVLAVIPLACLIWFVNEYTVDVPFWDQWDFMPLLQKSYEGALTLGDMLAQHNEHRPFFPWLIMIPLARFSGWNISYELAVNILLGVCILFVIVYQLRKTDSSIDGQRGYWPIPVLSLIVFSLQQTENWLWGWQMQVFLNILAVIVGIVLLTNYAKKWIGWWFALLMGIIGTYSFANGLIYWPICLLMLFLISLHSKKGMRLKMIIWAVISAIIIFTYMYRYRKPQVHPSLSLFFDFPLEYARYILIYLGSPLCRYQSNYAMLFGLFGLGIFSYTIWALISSCRIKLNVLAPYIACGFYSIGSAIITGIARLGFTSEQATTSRYVTVANLLWISNIALIYILGKMKAIELKQKLTHISSAEFQVDKVCMLCSRQAFSQAVKSSVITVIVLFLIFNSVFSMKEFKDRHAWLEPARKELLGPSKDDGLLKRLYPKPDIVRTRKEILKKYRLSVFR
jgi:hypothetical protein